MELLSRNRKPPASAYQQATNEGIAPSRYRKKAYAKVGVAERDIPRFDREQAMAQARNLTENDALIMGMVQTFVDNICGQGFRLNMSSGDPAWDKEVEALWHAEKDTLDVRGVRSWGKLIRCWQYRKTVDGDVGIYHNFVNPDDSRFYVQTIEADRIRSKKFDYLDQGVEYDDYGRPKRYWVSRRPVDQLDFLKQLEDGSPIDASDFHLHAHYPTDRVDMLRGVTMLLPMFNSIQDVREIMDAVRQKVKAAAFMAIVQTLDNPPTGINMGTKQDGEKTNEDGIARRTTALVPMSIAQLGKGEDMKVLESSEPSPNIEANLRFNLRYLGSAIGMPMELMLFDLNALNYSSARALMEMAKRRFRWEQESLKVPCGKVFRSWLDYRMTQGVLTPPSTLKTKYAHRWGTPSWPSLDPGKDVAAQGQAIGFGLSTNRRWLEENTDMTLEEYIEERQDELEKFKAAGIPVSLGQPGAVTVGNGDETLDTDDQSTQQPQVNTNESAIKKPDGATDAGTTAAVTLNGAQIQAAVEVVGNLVKGSLTGTTATELLVAVGLKREDAQRMVAEELSKHEPIAPLVQPK